MILFSFFCIFIGFLGCYSAISYFAISYSVVFSEVLSLDFLSFHYLLFLRLISEIDRFLKAKNQPFHELCNPLACWQIWTFRFIFKIISTLQTRDYDQLLSDLYLEMKTFCSLVSFMSRSSPIANVITFPHFLKGPLLIQRPKLNQGWANV